MVSAVPGACRTPEGRWNPSPAYVQIRSRVLQDQIILPVHQVLQEDVLLALPDDIGMDAEEGLRVRPQVHILREVVRFFLGVRADQLGILLHLVDVIGDACAEVVNLRQAAQPFVRLGVLSAHDQVARVLDGCFEGDPLARDAHVAQPFVRRADAVVGLGRRADPALGDPAPLADLVLLILQPQAASRRQEIPRHPRRFQPEDAASLGQGACDDVACCVVSHFSPSIFSLWHAGYYNESIGFIESCGEQRRFGKSGRFVVTPHVIVPTPQTAHKSPGRGRSAPVPASRPSG